MRLVLMGLAVVASLAMSLATSLTGADAQCSLVTILLGGSCDDPEWEATEVAESHALDERYAELAEDEALERQAMEEGRLIQERDEWADTYLAAEKAVATYWRWPTTEISRESGQREGTLYQHPRVTPTPDGPDNVYVVYVCDPNYDDAQSGGCVPADREYDCVELWSWGIANIPVIGEDWMLLDDDGDGVGCEPAASAQEAQSAIPSDVQGTALAALPEPTCTTSLTRLLPTPEEMGLEWTLASGTITGVECRTLDEVAASFENPAQAAADLAAFGWRENSVQTVSYGGDIRVSIHRFATTEGAATALEYFSSVQGEPAGTVPGDAALLEPNQRALIQPGSGWAALLEQDGEFVTRVTVRVNADFPPLSQAQSVLAAVHTRWSSYPQPSSVSRYFVDPETGETMVQYPDGTVVPYVETSGVPTEMRQEGAPVTDADPRYPGGYVPLVPDGAATNGAATREERAGFAVLPGDTVATSYPCDADYGDTATGGCVPDFRDYDCGELHDMGIGDIPVIGTDWMRLDGYQDFATGEWTASPDGLGCEWAGE